MLLALKMYKAVTLLPTPERRTGVPDGLSWSDFQPAVSTRASRRLRRGVPNVPCSFALCLPRSFLGPDEEGG